MKTRWNGVREHLAVMAWVATLQPTLVMASDASIQPMVVSMVLNGSLLSDAQLVYREAGQGTQRVWLPETVAKQWRLDVERRARRTFEGQSHVAVCERPDQCVYDESSALISLTVEHQDLMALKFSTSPGSELPAQEVKSIGGFLNYDLTAWQAERAGLAAFLNGRVHSPWGHGLWQYGKALGFGRNSIVLSRALWQIDWPSQGLSMQAGHITAPDTPLSPGLALTGFHLGTNAQLNPMASKQLRPQVLGAADRPQRTDVFVDGMFRQTADIPYGPYNIEVTPNLPGQGQIDLISTELDGTRRQITLPYYQAPQALAPGACEWSLDLGTLRKQPGQRVQSQTPLVSGAWRQGFQRGITGQAQWIAGPGVQRLAAQVDHVDARWGVSGLSLVTQRTAEHHPSWLGVGHEYVSRQASFNVWAEQALQDCPTSAGDKAMDEQLARPCQKLFLAAGLPLGPRWSASAALSAQRWSAHRMAHAQSLQLRFAADTRSQMTLSVQDLQVNTHRSLTLALTWTQPLGKYLSQTSVQSQQSTQLLWSVQSQPSPDEPTPESRWQVFGSMGQQHEVGGRWLQRMSQAEVSAQASVGQRGNHGALGMRGAIGYAEDRLFASRTIDDAFVIVDAGVPELPVLLDNREVARTNARGWAVITEARSQQTNRVGVDIAALPVQYAMPMDVQSVVPPLGAGALAVFEVSDGGVLLSVQDAHGQPLPTGAAVTVSTQKLGTAVTSRSEVFIERSDRASDISIDWGGKQCRFNYRPTTTPSRSYTCTVH